MNYQLSKSSGQSIHFTNDKPAMPTNFNPKPIDQNSKAMQVNSLVEGEHGSKMVKIRNF